jgi:hypothetical protein
MPTSIYLMKIPHNRWLRICSTIKASIRRESKQPRLSHSSSWVSNILGYKTIQVLEFLEANQGLLVLKAQVISRI